MKKLITHNWFAKIMTLVIAAGVWVLIKHYITDNPAQNYKHTEPIRSHP